MATAGATSMAMGSLNFGLFIKPMGDELGIGRSTFGWAQSARQLASAVTSPIIGPLIDRFGSRVLLPISAILTGAALVGLAFMSEAWQLVTLFAIMGLVGMSGPGALVTSVPVLKWFVRKRGRAVAMMSLGIPVGALIFVPLTQYFIDWWGWRTAWVVLAGLGVGIIVPLSLAFVRRQPEDLGLLPDGDPPQPIAREMATEPGSQAALRLDQEALDTSWTVREAVRSTVFWRLVAVFGVVALGLGIIGVHRIPAFMDRGLDATLISFATAIDAVCAGTSSFAMGMLVSKLPARYLGALGFTFLATASVLTIYATTIPIMFASMAVFGLGIGGMMFLQNYIWADYFGRAHLGAIRGLMMPITLLVGGIGAPLAGYVYDATGSYNGIWWGGVVLLTCAAVVTSTIRAPGRPPRSPNLPLSRNRIPAGQPAP